MNWVRLRGAMRKNTVKEKRVNGGQEQQKKRVS